MKSGPLTIHFSVKDTKKRPETGTGTSLRAW
jgi:hypothetical protein